MFYHYYQNIWKQKNTNIKLVHMSEYYQSKVLESRLPILTLFICLKNNRIAVSS